MSHYKVYQDSAREWRWRFVASNGLTIAVSSEGYANKGDCIHAINLVKGSYNAPVYD